jgi:dynein heavy chain
VMGTLAECRSKELEVNMQIAPILKAYSLLEYHLDESFIPQKEMDSKQVLALKWKKLIKAAEEKLFSLTAQQHVFKAGLLKDVKNFVADVTAFRTDFTDNGPMVRGIKPMVAVERLKRFKEELAIRVRKNKLYKMGEGLFKMPETEYPELAQTQKDIKLQDNLFSLYVDVVTIMEKWDTIEWTAVQEGIGDMSAIVDAFGLRCKKMPVRLRDYDAYTELKKTIEDLQLLLPLLTELSKPSIMERHWEEVKTIIGAEFEVETLMLKSLMDAHISNFSDEIMEVTEGADKQLKIEQQLIELTEHWTVQRFQFQAWKDRPINVLKTVVPIVEDLEESEMNMQTMLTMRHVAPFREEAQELLAKLSDSAETLDRWMKVQMLWCSLESVFTGGDIAKQMPVEAKKFQGVDKTWSKCMSSAFDTELVCECCQNEILKQSLPTMFGELEKCQKSLEGYLEQKRNKFPRFFFVSNPSLLLILSQGSDPLTMNAHYEKVFDSIFQVEHDKKDKTIIRTILSGSGATDERVPFVNPIKAVGNIEDWLLVIWYEAQVTLKDICKLMVLDCATATADVKALRHFVDTYIAQFALLGVQMMWTTDTQGALDNMKIKKSAMKETNTKQLAVLGELSSWCLGDLGTKENRTKIETLVTIHVHQRDVFQDLFNLFKQKKLVDANDFQWLMQARFSWSNDVGDDVDANGAQLITCTDVDFKYQFEYLGCKERLVVTPLTDRCYVALSQALGMYFGGAPAGPAGTGKTETTKDMGRALGVWVVVTNCTDQQSYLDCAKIFKGLCQGGLWGCFDEFNRIELPVLSVVAQYVLSILNGKRAGTSHFQFPGDPTEILLLPVCGFFITMNPGYAGRQELPENLKALFRGVMMMVPDFQIIMKVKLCSVGYTEFSYLAQKFFVLYDTNKQQLSNQRHYDWGLRNILAVLRTGGATKRANIEAVESVLMYQTLRDMNLSKLVAQDVPLFISLLCDLFPSIQSPASNRHPAEEDAIDHYIEEFNLVKHPAWNLKVIQLFETQLVRHGIMLVGPSNGGKSKIFAVLSNALAKVLSNPHKQVRMNPKAIRAPEMYGEIDPMSGEWTTGCFAAIWTKCNNRANKFISWIVMDGPVDAIWIEDLNTVLDDNRILTLANGDRIPMTANTKIMFEVETLVNASPATVSRAGIVYISDTDLDWAPVLEAWVRLRPESQSSLMRPMFEKYIGINTPTEPGAAPAPARTATCP